MTFKGFCIFELCCFSINFVNHYCFYLMACPFDKIHQITQTKIKKHIHIHILYMEQKGLYSILRIRFNDQLKLFPSFKLHSLEDVKAKAIARFDLQINESQFDLQYFDQQSNQVLELQNIPGTSQINRQVLSKLIKQKNQLQIVKKQPQLLSEIQQKFEKQPKKPIKSISPYARVNQQQNERQPHDKIQKHYAQCDKCMKFPILGVRYKCIICEDYDLCPECYKEKEEQKGAKCHPYIKLRLPINQIGKIKVSFKIRDIEKMDGCKDCQKRVEIIQKDFIQLQVDRSSLPRRTIAAKNFVQQLSGMSCVKRVGKMQQSLETAYP